MAFINRWKISQNWERNVKASDSAIWTYLHFKPRQRRRSLFVNGLRLEESVPEGTKSLLNDKTNILSSFSYTVQTPTPPPQKWS